MKCPVCKDVTLLMTEKKGIEIDYCPECRGIWLDRGELEKLVEKEQEYNKTNFEAPKHNDKDYEREEHSHHDYHQKYKDDYDNNYYHKKRRKKDSFMGEIFDIFGGDD